MKFSNYLLIYAIALSALISAPLIYFAWQNSHHYRDVDEFKADIDTWRIIGISGISARIIFEEKGFNCVENDSDLDERSKNSIYITCSRNLPGFPCDQYLQVQLKTNVDNLVNDFVILEVYEKLPTECL
ncbi:MAG: hypothetical protein VKN60_09805 [Cyanobacteriota bacterium]|nr:hypothetical protein [Cyanobacteriota bacterium]